MRIDKGPGAGPSREERTLINASGGERVELSRAEKGSCTRRGWEGGLVAVVINGHDGVGG